MKKIIILIAAVFLAQISYSQINVNSNGNVGIKTTNATKELTIEGEVIINAQSTPAYGSAIRTKVTNKDACAYHLYSNYYSQDVFYVSGKGFIWCKMGGYFGSDINMKEDIKDIVSPLDKIKKLRGVTYKYKDSKTKSAEKDKRMGLIAQEVEKIIPEVVKEMNDGTKAIAYTDLIGILVEAIKEQQTQIENMQTQIKKITSKDK